MRKTHFDLTQTIHETSPSWDSGCGFHLQNVVEYSEGLCVQEMQTPCGIGTHMDAPSHFFENADDISKLAIDKLICPGVVIDVSEKANESYAICESDIIEFERGHGEIPNGAIVLGHTGWGERWDSPERYRNADSDGKMHFPKFSVEAAQLLLARDISGIAIDTLSPDGDDYSFPVHHIILGADKFIIENTKVPAELPAIGFSVYALPMKINNATEAPCRVIATLEQ
jgi:kynurenine formamidase